MNHQFKQFKFDVKATAEPGTFEGRASVYGNVDAHNDVVMPGAFTTHLAEKGNRIVVLSQHDPSASIGFAELSDSSTALLARGKLILDLPAARDEYVRLKSGLVNGISIGYEVAPGGAKFVEGVRQLTALRLWEISLVTFPANDAARVTDIKRQGNGGSDIAASLDRLKATIREAKERVRASRTPDPVIAELEREFEKLNRAAKHWGADDPAVVAFAADLQAKLDAAKAAKSLAKLLATIRDTNRQLAIR